MQQGEPSPDYQIENADQLQSVGPGASRTSGDRGQETIGWTTVFKGIAF